MQKNKKGAVNARIMGLIGALIAVVIAVALAPSMFVGLTNITNAPSWVGVALPVIVGAGIIGFIWKAFR